MAYINKGGAVKVIYSIFYIIPQKRGDAFTTVYSKHNVRLKLSFHPTSAGLSATPLVHGHSSFCLFFTYCPCHVKHIM